ncbi:MAG: hypothetical protein AAGI01_12250, partial [Myxococcota bacterium]
MSFDSFDEQQGQGAKRNAEEPSQDSSLLGQRSESSVLFKLSDVDRVSSVANNSSDEDTTEGSGLIDIQHLSSMHSSSSAPNFAQDLHISPGTMSMPSIAASPSSSPPVGLIIAGALVIVLLVIGGAVAFVVTQQNNQPPRVIVQEREVVREVPAVNPGATDAEKAAEAARAAAANQTDPAAKEDDAAKAAEGSRKDPSASRTGSKRRDRDSSSQAKPPKKGVDSI